MQGRGLRFCALGLLGSRVLPKARRGMAQTPARMANRRGWLRLNSQKTKTIGLTVSREFHAKFNATDVKQGIGDYFAALMAAAQDDQKLIDFLTSPATFDRAAEIIAGITETRMRTRRTSET